MFRRDPPLHPAGLVGSFQAEEPIADWAPFAQVSQEVWRDLQRRRNLIRMVRNLADLARDESLPLCAAILADAARHMQAVLVQPGQLGGPMPATADALSGLATYPSPADCGPVAVPAMTQEPSSQVASPTARQTPRIPPSRSQRGRPGIIGA